VLAKLGRNSLELSMAKKRNKRRNRSKKRNPSVDSGDEATGIYTPQMGGSDLSKNPSQFFNWDVLAKIASEGLPGAKAMIRNSLLKEFHQNLELQDKFVSLMETLLEGAEQQMIGAARKNPAKRLPKRRSVSDNLYNWIESDLDERRVLVRNVRFRINYRPHWERN